MVSKVLFSSAKVEWFTPDDFYQQLNSEFRFDLDAAADATNHKCAKWLGPGSSLCEDGLRNYWGDYDCKSVWCNPPYGRTIGKWVKQAAESSWGVPGIVAAVQSVMLIPSRTDTRWFHDYIWDLERDTWREGVEGRFVKGRLKFGGVSNAAPFPSLVVVFRCAGL